jgi:hypothetical protein
MGMAARVTKASEMQMGERKGRRAKKRVMGRGKGKFYTKEDGLQVAERRFRLVSFRVCVCIYVCVCVCVCVCFVCSGP